MRNKKCVQDSEIARRIRGAIAEFFVTTKDAKSTKKEINQKGYKVHKLGVRFMAPSDERNERQKIV